MEQLRLFIAIALSFLVFLVWNFFFVEQQPAVNTANTPVKSEQPVLKEFFLKNLLYGFLPREVVLQFQD